MTRSAIKAARAYPTFEYEYVEPGRPLVLRPASRASANAVAWSCWLQRDAARVRRAAAPAMREQLRQRHLLELRVKLVGTLGEDRAERGSPRELAGFHHRGDHRRRHRLGARADVHLVGDLKSLGRPDLPDSHGTNRGHPAADRNGADQPGQMKLVANRRQQVLDRRVALACDLAGRHALFLFRGPLGLRLGQSGAVVRRESRLRPRP